MLLGGFLFCVLASVVWISLNYKKDVVERYESARTELYKELLSAKAERSLQIAAILTQSFEDVFNDDYPKGTNININDLMSAAITGQGEIYSLAIIDGNGLVIASSNKWPIYRKVDWSLLQNQGSQNRAEPSEHLSSGLKIWVSDVRSGSSVYDMTEYSARTGQEISLPIVRRLRVENRGAIFIVAMLNLRLLAKEFESTDRMEGISTFLVDANNRVIISSKPDTIKVGLAYKKELNAPTTNQLFDGKRQLGQWPLFVRLTNNASTRMIYGNREAQLIYALGLVLWIVLFCASLVLRSLALRAAALKSEVRETLAVASSLALQRDAVLQASSDAIFIIDSTGFVVDRNAAAAAKFENAERTSVDKNLERFVLPESARDLDMLGIHRYVNSADATLSDSRIELTAVDVNETEFPVEISIKVILLSTDLNFSVTIRDISERVRSERRHREAEDTWRIALEVSGEGVSDWSVEKNSVQYSKQWLAMFGYDESDMAARYASWQPLVHPSDLVLAYPLFLAHLKGHLPAFYAEYRVRCKDGSWKWVQGRGLVIQRDVQSGRAMRFMVTQVDISERKLIEAERAEVFQKSTELSSSLLQAKESEVRLGRSIQSALLTTRRTFPARDVWIHAFNQPSQGVDGDFFEVISLDADCVDVILGDVMGKGFGAALMGAGVKMALIRSIMNLIVATQRSRVLPQPVAIVSALQSAINTKLSALEAFVTLSYFRINKQLNTLTWVGCGHEEAMLLRNGHVIGSLTNQQPPIGATFTAELKQDVVPFLINDALFLHSDGASDAIDANGARVGKLRIQHELETLNQRHRTPAAVIHSMRKAVFGPDVRVLDDLTLVLVQRVTNASSISRYELSFDLHSLRFLRRVTAKIAEEALLSSYDTNLLILGTVEVFSNIVRHTKEPFVGSLIEMIASVLPNAVQINF